MGFGGMELCDHPPGGTYCLTKVCQLCLSVFGGVVSGAKEEDSLPEFKDHRGG